MLATTPRAPGEGLRRDRRQALAGANVAPAAASAQPSAKRVVPTRSLKARAIHWLSLREQSRVELRRKLLPHAVAELEAERAACASDAGHESAVFEPDVPVPRALQCGADAGDVEGHRVAPAAMPDTSARVRVEALLDWLEANGYLSDERFVESRVQARAPRFGNLRIRRELNEHRLVLSVEALQLLQATELSRGHDLYARRYADPPADATERARRARFLHGRGFSFDVIAKVLGKP